MTFLRSTPWLLALGLLVLPPARAADTLRTGATQTALDRYVAAPDPSFRWKKVGESRRDGVTITVIDLVSQTWLTPAEVDKPEWRHWLVLVRPDTVTSSTALLMLSGGTNTSGQKPYAGDELIRIAKGSHCVVALLRMVPNSPLIFRSDGKERYEDDLIAVTWEHFLKTGDERWPARLPMTKAAVRAMDATSAYFASEEGGRTTIDRYVVAGASKRGWTTWTTAAVDRRVVAICPMVIGVLNVERSMQHHYQAYGFYSPAVDDYVRHHITDWWGTPEARALFAIEDPYSYRDRLTLPKLIINAGGDQFFLPDSSRFYFEALHGVSYLRTIPNTDHSLRNSDAYETLEAWQYLVLKGGPFPAFSWTHAGNTVTVTTKTKPRAVRLWQATNPHARDFRLETIGKAWRSTDLSSATSVYTASVPDPRRGWTASFVELTYDVGARVPLILTTDVTVAPDTLPFPPPHVVQPKGFLQKASKGPPSAAANN